jgi:hypothetical protein
VHLVGDKALVVLYALYSVTMEKVLIHISDISHDRPTPLSDNYMVQLSRDNT